MTPITSALARLALITTAMILGTIALGWAGPIFVAAVLAGVDGRSSVPRETGTAAALGWLIIVLFTLAVAGGRPVALLGAALQMPAFVLPLASVLFAAGLAWSSATLVAALRHAIVGRRLSTTAAQPPIP